MANLRIFGLRFENNFFLSVFFFSPPFTDHKTAGEGGRHFLNSSLPLPPASQTVRQ